MSSIFTGLLTTFVVFQVFSLPAVGDTQSSRVELSKKLEALLVSENAIGMPEVGKEAGARNKEARVEVVKLGGGTDSEKNSAAFQALIQKEYDKVRDAWKDMGYPSGSKTLALYAGDVTHSLEAGMDSKFGKYLSKKLIASKLRAEATAIVEHKDFIGEYARIQLYDTSAEIQGTEVLIVRVYETDRAFVIAVEYNGA